MTKNPFEVRLDVLKMAQEMLESEQRIKMVKFKETIDTLRSAKMPEEHILNTINNDCPVPYSTTDLAVKSSTLYEFISKKQ